MKSEKDRETNTGKLGTCALCLNKTELKLSHRIPKAVGAIIKKDSFTKKLRSVFIIPTNHYKI